MFKYLQYALMALILLVAAPKIWSEYKDRENSKSWPAVTGTLLTGHVKEVTRTSNEDSKWPRREHYFELNVTYSYEVDGRSYIGRRVQAGGKKYDTQAKAAADLLHFQSKTPFVILYNPKKPESSVLETG